MIESTITVQDLINFAEIQNKLAPLVGLGAFEKEPALTFANRTKKRIINSRFNWPWNRKAIPSFKTVENKFEYIVPSLDIGRLERAYMISDSDLSVYPMPQKLEVVQNLNKSWHRGQPKKIALDVGRVGSSVVRIEPTPDNQIFTIYCDYQRAPTKIRELSGTEGTFSPIPDTMEDVLHAFFVAFAYALYDRQASEKMLIDAERLLIEFKSNEDMPESEIIFVPDYPLFDN